MATEVSTDQVIFRAEPLAAVWDEASPLFAQHWQESGYPELGFRLDRDWYERLETIGVLKGFVAREAETDRLLGYASFIVGPQAHSPVIQAAQDTFYLRPEARRGWLALRFLTWIEGQLAASCVDVIFQHAREHSPLHVLLRRRAYRPVQTLFMKRLIHV